VERGNAGGKQAAFAREEGHEGCLQGADRQPNFRAQSIRLKTASPNVSSRRSASWSGRKKDVAQVKPTVSQTADSDPRT